MQTPIFTGIHGRGHIQGIAVDQEKGFIYYSFTTRLVKSTLSGKVVGSVTGLTGHLGCIDFHEADGRVYGSLEYKNDGIGRGIRASLGLSEEQAQNAFYIAIFDVDRITRMDMDAEADGIMTAVYLKEVVDDFHGSGIDRTGAPVPHRYGCSGIDGITFGPMFGSSSQKEYLFVTYGIYSDTTRDDNDHQVLLCYDTTDWKPLEAPLSQANLHHSGPEAPTKKLFLFTGNTTYGVQNLEYDAYSHAYYMAVYTGTKPEFPNYSLFAADATVAPTFAPLRGLSESGWTLSLLPKGNFDSQTGLYGWRFPHGSTGLFACGDGTYYISEPHATQSGQCSFIYRYVFDERSAFLLEE